MLAFAPMKKRLATLPAFVLFSSLLFINIFANVAFAFPKNDLKPGGVAILPVANSAQREPKVFDENKNQVAVIHGKSNWLAIVGISLDARPGLHYISIRTANGKTRKKGFRVHQHKYRTQRLTIRNKNKVNPNKKSMKRILREMKLKKRLIKTYSNSEPSLSFIKPVAGRDSGRFGARRIFNKQKRKPHSGMDIASPAGRSIHAASRGKVLYTGNLFFTGKVVYIDHGEGLISLYAHMSKINVKKGQTIKQGQTIGRVGMTGRVTGPHLHWSVYLNGNAVDPALFLPGKLIK